MYTVYKVTNLINDKYYIGVHKTDNPNDSYMGSGIAIKNAIKKYGKDNFKKDVLFETDIKDEAYKKEIELTDDYNKHHTYNMKRGGVGGFTKENSIKGNLASMKSNAQSKGGKSAVEKGYGFGGKFNDAKVNGKKGGEITAKKLRGVSRTGNVTWEIVDNIRSLYDQNTPRKEIKSIYPLLTPSTIYDITTYKTWK